ncbi:septum site-determining protein MinC [bioreactor metagenome]|uniref:Septum site-determining protein MinC n=1 Tax=bioreactor metagenome TaxID=1076179 RepID=A0A645E809_9ZZZZ|nr:septum site-determining protein MinC [Lachnospiraceae bacterium]
MIVFSDENEIENEKENDAEMEAVNTSDAGDDADEIEISIAQTGDSMGNIIEAAEAKDAAEKTVITDLPEGEIDISANKRISELVATEFIKEHHAKFHKGNLRSGMVLEYDGSIILLGDVNPGAQIRATGNIIVLGALKGVAHAGAQGERDAYVFALNLAPVQLRIADIITRFPDNGNSKSNINPEYAYVEDGTVYVSAFE